MTSEPKPGALALVRDFGRSTPATAGSAALARAVADEGGVIGAFPRTTGFKGSGGAASNLIVSPYATGREVPLPGQPSAGGSSGFALEILPCRCGGAAN